MQLHLFDFDGTISKNDSLFLFLKFVSSGFRYYGSLLVYAPLFGLALAGLMSKSEVKRKLISFHLYGLNKELLSELSHRFYEQILKKNLRKKAIQKIKELQENQYELYVVSASLEIWLKPFCEDFNMKLICTKAKYENNIFIGIFDGANCNRTEKQLRILKEIDLKKFSKVIAYGDSSGDRQMFELANLTFYKPFR